MKLQDKFVPLHVMKAYGRLELHFHLFLTSELDGGEWLLPRRGCFTRRKALPVPIQYESVWAPEQVWKF